MMKKVTCPYCGKINVSLVPSDLRGNKGQPVVALHGDPKMGNRTCPQSLQPIDAPASIDAPEKAWVVAPEKNGPRASSTAGDPVNPAYTEAKMNPCIHTNGIGLCLDCQTAYDDDPLAYIEFGDHPEGIRRWQELQAEMEAERQRPVVVRIADDELPF